jgi:hypothetical protein
LKNIKEFAIFLDYWNVLMNHKKLVYYQWSKDKDNLENQFKTFSYDYDLFKYLIDFYSFLFLFILINKFKNLNKNSKILEIS